MSQDEKQKSQEDVEYTSEYVIVGEAIPMTKGADLDYIFNRNKRRDFGSFRKDVIDHLYSKLTHTGALWKIKIESTNGSKPSRKFIEKKFNQVRTSLRDEAKTDPGWDPDERGHYVRTTVVEDEQGVLWLWVQRLGPKHVSESVSINR